MRRFRRPRSLLKSPSSSCAQCSRITLMRGRSHCWRSPCRILRSTRTCSWNFHLGLKMSGADLAPSRAWRVGWLTVPLTGSAIVSDGMLSDTGPSRWSSRDPFRTSFANWPKRTFNQCHIGSTKCVGCGSGCLLHVWSGTTPIHRLDKSCTPPLTCVPPRPARHLEIAQ